VLTIFLLVMELQEMDGKQARHNQSEAG